MEQFISNKEMIDSPIGRQHDLLQLQGWYDGSYIFHLL